MKSQKDIVSQIRHAVISGEKEAIIPLVEQALTEGISSITITEDGLTDAMNEVGIVFGSSLSFSATSKLLSAETMRAALYRRKGIDRRFVRVEEPFDAILHCMT